MSIVLPDDFWHAVHSAVMWPSLSLKKLEAAIRIADVPRCDPVSLSLSLSLSHTHTKLCI